MTIMAYWNRIDAELCDIQTGLVMCHNKTLASSYIHCRLYQWHSANIVIIINETFVYLLRRHDGVVVGTVG